MTKNKLEKMFSKSLKAEKLSEEKWKELYQQYLAGKSPKQLGKEYKRSHQNIRLNFKKRKWKVRNQKEAGKNRTKNNPNFDGKRLIQDYGYSKKAMVKYKGKLIKESHYVYCKANNIKILPKGYDIHHIDFNTLNNNIKNLQLIEHKEHTKLHWRLGKNC